MRVAKHLAPAGYLQAHAFNLDGNRFARRLRKLLLHMADELFGGALSPAFWWDLDLYGQPRFVRDLDLNKANRAFAVGISR